MHTQRIKQQSKGYGSQKLSLPCGIKKRKKIYEELRKLRDLPTELRLASVDFA